MEPNKLPEGRKPLPDEWFAERAQMQDRIKELEAKLAKLTKAADRLHDCYYDSSVFIAGMTDLIVELTGGKDE